MRFLILVTDLLEGVGGIQSFNRSLIAALAQIAQKYQWDVRILALHDSFSAVPAGSWLAEGNVHYQGYSGSRTRFTWAAMRESQKADRIIFGHIHFAALASLMRDIPKVLIAHGIESWSPVSAPARLGLSGIHQVWAVSEFTREKIMTANHIPAARCRVLHNTLSLREEKKRPAHRSGARKSGSKMLLTVSRLEQTEKYKCIDHVIALLPALLREQPSLSYVIVGEGSDRPRLEALAKSLSVENCVTFAGAVSSDVLEDYYEECDLFVLPSSGEGFGIVFLEAMAHAKPCVGARAGGIPEVIDHGKTGCLIEPNDPLSLQTAIRHLLNSDSDRLRMGTAGLQRYQQKFAFPVFVDRVENLLQMKNLSSRPVRHLAA